MGWCESPPFFCSGSETARDVIADLYKNTNLPEHRIEHDMLRNIMIDTTTSTPNNFITLFEVFVDDFVGYTNDGSSDHLRKVSRAMIHGIHSTFPPPELTCAFAISRAELPRRTTRPTTCAQPPIRAVSPTNNSMRNYFSAVVDEDARRLQVV